MTGLPADLADVLRPELPALAGEIVAAIGREVDDYARPFDGPFGDAVRAGTVRALGRFLDSIDRPGGPSERARAVYVELGRGEYRAGRSLDALLSAYRIGARLAWRRFVEAGKAAGTEPDVLYRLGEAIFAYIEGLSAESREGYAEAQWAEAGERSRQRRRLVALLLQQPPADARSLLSAAERVGWEPPATLAALVTADVDPDVLANRLGVGALAADVDPEPRGDAGSQVVALVPDPLGPGRRAQIERALGRLPGTLGHAVPWLDAAASLERALLARRLQAEGSLPGGLVAAADHLAALVVGADPSLSRDLAAAALAPLDALPSGPRAKLEHTLRAWLDHQGRVEVVAAALGVHPQTVRYRLGRLRELFGDRLERPEERFALALALRS